MDIRLLDHAATQGKATRAPREEPEWIVLRTATGLPPQPEEGFWCAREKVGAPPLRVTDALAAFPVEQYEREERQGPIAQVWEIREHAESELESRVRSLEDRNRRQLLAGNDSIPSRLEDWPCRTSPRGQLPPRLVHALYIVLRDHIHPGDLEQVMLNVRGAEPDTQFTNPHLLAYAENLATYLTLRSD